jgi:hypothetical protein
VPILVLVGFTVVPNVSTMLHKAATRRWPWRRDMSSLMRPIWGPLGRVVGQGCVREQAERMRQHLYRPHRDTFEAIAETEASCRRSCCFPIRISSICCFRKCRRVTAAIKCVELRNRRRFETILNLDFANPFPFILNRKGTLSCGHRRRSEPGSCRRLTDRRARPWRETDLVLAPVCPVHALAQTCFKEHYAPALGNHERITLTPCYDAYVHPPGT